jgi:hypothetical protein
MTFFDVQLGASPADVRFALGNPDDIVGEENKRWAYHVGDIDAKRSAMYFVRFRDGRVAEVFYLASRNSYSAPNFLGFTHGSDYSAVLERLGPPSFTSVTEDELTRMLSYEKLNVFFSFKASKLEAYGIYNPANGPMKFSVESAPTEKK